MGSMGRQKEEKRNTCAAGNYRVTSAGSPVFKIVLLLISCLLIAVSTTHSIAASSSDGGYIMEMPLDRDGKLDAIRYLQARILQPYSNARYLVRNATVLLPGSGIEGYFAYLVTLQASVPGNRAYDLSEFYSVAGYYLIMIKRDGDGFTIVDEIQLTPPELVERLRLGIAQPPPELTSNPDEFDFSDAVYDATDPELVDWRDQLVNSNEPWWDWSDLTGDGWLDCILNIEGFEFHPTSYYLVLVTTSDGFLEGFRSWGYNTFFSEKPTDYGMAIIADRYSVSANGDFMKSWMDYYIWDGFRFAIENEKFAGNYDNLIEPLEELISQALAGENSSSGRWTGLTRFEINATRYKENIGIPSQYYFYLARIAEYQDDAGEAARRWRILVDYLNEEYDSQAEVDIEALAIALQGSLQTFIDWRDELFNAAEAALTE